MPAARFRVSGRVQGVGYRYFVQISAESLGVCGWGRNCSDGSVEGVIQGDSPSLNKLAQQIKKGPPGSLPGAFEYKDIPELLNLKGFSVRF